MGIVMERIAMGMRMMTNSEFRQCILPPYLADSVHLAFIKFSAIDPIIFSAFIWFTLAWTFRC